MGEVLDEHFTHCCFNKSILIRRDIGVSRDREDIKKHSCIFEKKDI